MSRTGGAFKKYHLIESMIQIDWKQKWEHFLSSTHNFIYISLSSPTWERCRSN